MAKADSKTRKPVNTAPKPEVKAADMAVKPDVDEMAKRLSELEQEIADLQKGNAEQAEEIGELSLKLNNSKEVASKQTDLITDLTVDNKALQAQIDEGKVDALPQAIRLDVLCGAAYSKTLGGSTELAARIACELHDQLVMEVAKRKAKTDAQTRTDTSEQTA